MQFFENIKLTFQRYGILTKIIAINVAVFLTINLVGNLSHLNLLPFFGLPVGGSAFVTKFWTFFTYMFTHMNLGHLFWNMLLFYFMSQVFFTILGEKKLLYLYVMSGLCGGALVLMMGLLFPASFADAILIGASAAVLGVGAVMAVYSPNYRVFLFGLLEMPYKYFYLLTFVLSTIIDLSVNTGGKISHMGGAAFGIIYGLSLKRGTDLSRFSFGYKKKSPLKIVSYNKDEEADIAPGNEEQRMNRLLDKISKGGYDSLTKKEKDELYKLSQKKN
jgi:membrane associated rhomboid family serine protease